MEISISQLNYQNNLKQLCIQVDSQISSTERIASTINLLNLEMSSLVRILGANFQITAFHTNDKTVVVGDEYGVIHLMDSENIKPRKNSDAIDTYDPDCDINYNIGAWLQIPISNVAICAVCHIEHVVTVVCLANHEVLVFEGNQWSLCFNSSEPITLCEAFNNGDIVLASDNQVYLRRDNYWFSPAFPDYDLPRVVFTSICIVDRNNVFVWGSHIDLFNINICNIDFLI